MIRNNSRSILIVNREPDTADLLAEMLLMGDETYILNIAYTGKECLNAMEHNSPDLVLMDIELPDMDGWDLADNIRNTPKDIPVIIITSKRPVFEDFTRFSMISDYLMKPVTLDGLHMAVKDALELPELLEKCLKSLKNCKEENVYDLFRLLKQNIYDRKQYILMKQLYPDRIPVDDARTKILLDNLKEKINKVQKEINYFKNYPVLFA